MADHFDDFQKQLYPINKKAEIDKHILWYQTTLKPVCRKIVREVIDVKAYKEPEYLDKEKK